MEYDGKMKRSKIPNDWPRLLILSCAILAGLFSTCHGQENRTTRENSFRLDRNESDTCIDVTIDSHPFTTFRYRDYAKPILYPVYAADGIEVTRHWPMRDDVPGEMRDHPHHKSIWVGHIINGVDFWTEKNGRVEVSELTLDDENAAINVKSNWIPTNHDQPLLSDHTVYAFGAKANVRWIDATINFRSDLNDLVFEDTKEGTFAIRTHSNLQLTRADKNSVSPQKATARNSNAETGKEIWGKKANWVLYQGKINDQSVALAMFDHPTNLRHPTTWHARDYGLIAANPFGLHDFQGAARGAGEYCLKRGETLSLRYRLLFVLGEPSDESIDQLYQEFSR